MHIPDGFLDTKTVATAATLSAAAITVALRNIRTRLPRRKLPLMGVAAAFVFAAQMFNFPLPGGTSGHLVGAVLTSVLLGPGAAVVVIFTVLLVQCLVFADGGLLALGANVLNMAVVGSAGGFGAYRLLRLVFRGERGKFLAIGIASWCSTVLASVFCSAELAWSGVVAWGVVFPVMTSMHALIGIGEGVITMLIVGAVGAARPELADEADTSLMHGGYGELAAYGFLISIGLILFVLPFASSLPDGLEHAASMLGFGIHSGGSSLVHAPAEGYSIPGIHSPFLATAVAGGVGIILAFVLATTMSRWLTRKSLPKANNSSSVE